MRLLVEPARYRNLDGVKTCVQQEIRAAACWDCSGRTQNQPPPVRTPSTVGRNRPKADQMTIYDALDGDAA